MHAERPAIRHAGVIAQRPVLELGPALDPRHEDLEASPIARDGRSELADDRRGRNDQRTVVVRWLAAATGDAEGRGQEGRGDAPRQCPHPVLQALGGLMVQGPGDRRLVGGRQAILEDRDV